MISKEQMDAAQREYDAKPGTPADLTLVADISKVKGSQPSAIAKVISPMSDGLREKGYQYFRCTAPADDEDHVYLEAWWTRPDKQGKLNRAAATQTNPGTANGDR